ncbi:sensor histidine kinase [Streptomyces sp. NBC_01477]|uniref:sensor histidine kinase n=1 Tax=Streptomyces sp. NBC_01477 TaxID=2976015 RepID=UPI002E31DF19|nr:sensor histidine kinase [Streptomyces sp. NBC_01477]
MNDHVTAPTAPDTKDPGFRHELFPYQGETAFLDGTVSFVKDAVAGGEAVLVAVDAAKQEILRQELAGTDAAKSVTYLDAAALSCRPGRLISAWAGHITDRAAKGQPVRGISESQWTGRTPGERAELQYHEWLLNRAFAATPAWWLLCPYDTTTVEADVLQSARSNHPLLRDAQSGPNTDHQDGPYPFPGLGAPCDPYQELVFHAGDLARVRDKVTACAGAHHLEPDRLLDLLAAVTEAAANSIRHGGGTGTLRTWTEQGELVCEVRDTGHLQDPLAGHVRPRHDQIGGRGLWLIHQLCDLVQIRTTQDGTTVRMITALS